MAAEINPILFASHLGVGILLGSLVGLERPWRQRMPEL